MSWFWGSKATETPDATSALKEVKKQIAVCGRRIRDLEKSIAKQKATASALGKRDRNAAKRMIPAIRRDETKLGQQQTVLQNLRLQLQTSTGVSDTVQVARAMKLSTQATKAQMATMDVDDIKNTIDEASELHGDMDEINRLMAEPMGGSSDTDAIYELETDEYLDGLLFEEEDVPAVATAAARAQPPPLTMPDVPVAHPYVRKEAL